MTDTTQTPTRDQKWHQEAMRRSPRQDRFRWCVVVRRKATIDDNIHGLNAIQRKQRELAERNAGRAYYQALDDAARTGEAGYAVTAWRIALERYTYLIATNAPQSQIDQWIALSQWASDEMTIRIAEARNRWNAKLAASRAS